MGKYGLAALKAVNLIESNRVNTPLEAWNYATSEIFGQGSWGQLKGCPKNAFLGICEEGIVRGVKRGTYSRSKKNKAYAMKAIEILTKDPNLAEDMNTLWNYVTNGSNISHNHQMDVVVSLWKNNFIQKKISKDTNYADVKI